MFSTVWNTQRFTELDREEMGEKRDRGHLEEKKESPEERVVKPVITSLCALHSLDHSEVFTELYGEEEREEVDRGDQEDQREE